ncbi:hypothetical protein [Malonomonas rubra]|uniref:hypothetical protein n=1 Tax=Malonomonas rubra TaxID=57040 RepID=UPI0026F0BA37|nr:hypothetical protein [Malonomonas rubra]
MMLLLTGPICLLCFYLSFLCLRRKFHKHALVLGGVALFFLVLSLALIGAGYFTWLSLNAETIARL